jgi:hypothetical protein
MTTEEKAEENIDSAFKDLVPPETPENLPPPKKERKKRESKKLTPVLLFDEETILSLIRFPFDYGARRYGDFWRLQPEEEKALSLLVNKVSSKWIPEWLEKFSDELALTILMFQVLYPRYMTTRDVLAIKKRKEENASEIPPLSSPEQKEVTS